MPLVIRFIDERNEVREEFITFILCDKGLTGAALKDKIIENIKDVEMDISFCRGQGYDGGGKHVRETQRSCGYDNCYVSVGHIFSLRQSSIEPLC